MVPSLDDFWKEQLERAEKHLAKSKQTEEILETWQHITCERVSVALSAEEMALLGQWIDSKRGCSAEGQDSLEQQLVEHYGQDFPEASPEVQLRWILIKTSAFTLSSLWCQVSRSKRHVLDAEKDVLKYQEKV